MVDSNCRELRDAGIIRKKRKKGGQGGDNPALLFAFRELYAFSCVNTACCRVIVAPLTGAWIETCPAFYRLRRYYVAPLTGAWIETTCQTAYSFFIYVAPLTGAWIETNPSRPLIQYKKVAPLTGAWIETSR